MNIGKLVSDRVLRQELLDAAELFADAIRANPDLDRENLEDYYSDLMAMAYICGICPDKNGVNRSVKETLKSLLEPLMGIEKKKEEETDDGES